MPRRYVARLHYSRPGVRTGRPWTVHAKGQCILATHVAIRDCPVVTKYDPDKAHNPRAWLRVYYREINVSPEGSVYLLG